MEFLSMLQNRFDDLKPSLFELLSEQQLSSLLPPTLRYLVAAAAQRRPRYLLRLLNSFDEAYALLSLVVEQHYLRTRGASFTEAFYGLRRERAPRVDTPRTGAAAPSIIRDALAIENKPGDIWRNLLVVVLLPYLKRKLDDAYEVEAPRAAVMGARYTQMPEGATARQKLLFYYSWFLRNVYPSVNAAYYFAFLAFNLAYMFDNSRFHNPFNWLVGTRLRRMSAMDHKVVLGALASANSATAAAVGQTPAGRRPLFSLQAAGPRLLSSLSVMLPVGIFALKFLEWWHASDFAKHLSQKTTQFIDLPPPAVQGLDGREVADAEEQQEAGSKSRSGPARPTTPLADDAPIAAASLLPILTVPAPEDSSLCPICEGDITNPTACQTGVVFCYACIHRWVDGTHPYQEEFMEAHAGRWESGQGRCAVTGRRVLGGTEGLRRIMV